MPWSIFSAWGALRPRIGSIRSTCSLQAKLLALREEVGLLIPSHHDSAATSDLAAPPALDAEPADRRSSTMPHDRRRSHEGGGALPQAARRASRLDGGAFTCAKHERCNHLHRLATNPGERCGLDRLLSYVALHPGSNTRRVAHEFANRVGRYIVTRPKRPQASIATQTRCRRWCLGILEGPATSLP